jgi:hypothetical protein
MAIERKVDVLLTDDEMPGLTGRELIGIMRKHRAVVHCLLNSELGPDFPKIFNSLPCGAGR